MTYLPKKEDMIKFKEMVEGRDGDYKFSQARQAIIKHEGDIKKAVDSIMPKETLMMENNDDKLTPWTFVRNKLQQKNNQRINTISNEVQMLLENEQIKRDSSLDSLDTLTKVTCIAGIYLIVIIKHNHIKFELENLLELNTPVNLYRNLNNIKIPTQLNTDDEINNFFNTSEYAGIASIYKVFTALGAFDKNIIHMPIKNNTDKNNLIEEIKKCLKKRTNITDNDTFSRLINFTESLIIPQRESTFSLAAMEAATERDAYGKGGKKTRKRKRKKIIKGKKSRKSIKGKKSRKNKKLHKSHTTKRRRH